LSAAVITMRSVKLTSSWRLDEDGESLAAESGEVLWH
jgi:hypothetical protein